MADIKYNYKLNVKGLMTVEDNTITLSVEDVGDVNLANLCSDFNGKEVKVNITHDYDYEETEVKVDLETGEVI